MSETATATTTHTLKSVRGSAPAECSCGWASDEPIETAAGRKAAYNHHVAEVASEDEDLIGDTQPKAEPKPEPEPVGPTVDVTYTKALSFFKPLVREGARGLAEDLGVFVKVNTNTKSVTVKAQPEDAERLTNGISALWDTAMVAFKAFKKDDAPYREARSRSMQEGYVLEKEFLADFATGVRNAVAGIPKKRASAGVKAGQDAYAESPELQALSTSTASE